MESNKISRDHRNIVIKKPDKGSCTKTEQQLSNKNDYKQVSFKEKPLCDLVEISDMFFRGLKLDGHISEKE